MPQMHASWLENCTGQEPDDVAIAAAIGMSWEDLRPMVLSFRYFAGWCATLALLVDALLPPEVNKTLRAYGASLVPVSGTWPFLEDVAALPQAALQRLIPQHVAGLVPDVSAPGLRLVTLRYLLAEAWLRARGAPGAAAAGHGDGLLMLVDSADVVFQDDPFAAVEQLRGSREAWIFEEHPSRIILECPFNAVHARAFGPAFGAEAKAETVVNSGVIVGALAGVLELVDALRRVVLSFPDRELNDQAILNYLTREPRARPLLPRGVKVIPHHMGPVRNVGPELFQMWRTYDPHSVRLGLDDEGWLMVLGVDGGVAPIVHQYNRNGMLRDALSERWQFSEFGNAGEIRRHCLVTGLCSNVYELEHKLNERIQEARSCHLRSCGSYYGGCQAKWKERRDSLMSASGAFLRVRHEVASQYELCRSLGETISVAVSFNTEGWVKDLAEVEPDKRTELLDFKDVLKFITSAELANEWQVAGSVPVEVRPLGPRPSGLRWRLPPRVLCMDEACGTSTPTEERAEVAWEAARELLLRSTSEGAEVSRVFAQISGAPGPEHRWLRHLHWAAGQPVPPGSNASTVTRHIRLRRLPGD